MKLNDENSYLMVKCEKLMKIRNNYLSKKYYKIMKNLIKFLGMPKMCSNYTSFLKNMKP